MRCLAVLLVFLCSTATAAAAGPGAGILPFASGGADFDAALIARPFEFPRDHGPHSTFSHEWWYLTGHLAASSGERFGFELTFFRVALARSAARESSADTSRWRANDIYVAHFAVTDIERGQFKFAQRSARGALGLAGAEASPLHVWLDGWRLLGPGNDWQLKAAQPGYSLTLAMQPQVAAVANGAGGLSQKSADPKDATYYYSIPRLSVHGVLSRDGRDLNVTGEAWLDREWGSGALAKDEAGWDWYALQLSDGSTLMFYSLRRLDGSQEEQSGGTWLAPDGSTRALARNDVQIKVLGQWRSPRGGLYPARWQISVASLALSVGVTPVLADQELDVRPRYWEGAVDVSGTRDTRPITGQGYVELVGYAAPP